MTSTSAPFGWAVVGLGKHTRNWVAPAIVASDRGELVAVVSRDTQKAARISAAWGSRTVYGQLAQALADPRVDGVWLVTPNQLHRHEVEACAAAGKHVLCEKPLAVSVKDCEAMVSACERAGVMLGVGFHLRHNLIHERARAMVAAGAIGDIRFASIRYAHRTAPDPRAVTAPAKNDDPDAIPTGPAAWRRDPELAGGGAFVGNGVHTIDLLRFLTGHEILSVNAMADLPDAHELNLLASVRMDDGALASLHGGDIAYPVNEVVISGTLGTIHCVDSIGNIGGGSLTLTTADGRDTLIEPEHNVYVRESDDFVARVRSGRPADASGLDGLRCSQVVEAIYQASASGTHVAVSTS